ncbi:MAG: hypothetical protein WD733_11475 [Bryobacterales bacterium]
MPIAKPAILPDHILSAVLTLAKRAREAEASARKRLAFRSHDFQLQEIFSDLQKTGKYPILDAFVFSDSGPERYSPALNESVSKLQLSGLIGRENPDYEVVFLRPAADRFFDEVLSSRFSNDLDQLGQIANEFLQRVEIIDNVG